MPRIYLSPSTQDQNDYVNGGTEEYYMNLVADAMEPWLISSGISFTRNTPEMTAASSIRQANSGTYDLYVALHSNGAPPNKYGTVRGTEIYYYPASTQGKRAAQLIENNFKVIHPIPSLVRIIPTTSLGEVAKSRAPAVLVEIAYHDNESDAQWIKDNIRAIARTMVLSITEYFGVPLVDPQVPAHGTVTLQYGSLNIRQKPSLNAPILIHAPNGAVVNVLGEWEGWYVVRYNGVTGYAVAKYIEV